MCEALQCRARKVGVGSTSRCGGNERVCTHGADVSHTCRYWAHWRLCEHGNCEQRCLCLKNYTTNSERRMWDIFVNVELTSDSGSVVVTVSEAPACEGLEYEVGREDVRHTCQNQARWRVCEHGGGERRRLRAKHYYAGKEGRCGEYQSSLKQSASLYAWSLWENMPVCEGLECGVRRADSDPYLSALRSLASLRAWRRRAEAPVREAL